MKYNIYYRIKEERLFSNISSTFILNIRDGQFKSASLEGERIIYEKK